MNRRTLLTPTPVYEKVTAGLFAFASTASARTGKRMK